MENKQRIGNVSAGFMIGVAAIIDLVQFLLTLTAVLVPLAVLCTFFSATMFAIWFMIYGVKYVGHDNGKKLLIALASTVAEFVPVINALPATTVGVIGIIVQSRIEDARANTGKKVTPRTAMAVARARKMQAARTQRADAARESRQEDRQARHAPANDNTEDRRSEAA